MAKLSKVKNLKWNINAAGSQFVLSWDEVENATGYMFYRNGKYVKTVSTTKYTDTDTQAYGQKVEYQVCATNDEGQGALSSTLTITPDSMHANVTIVSARPYQSSVYIQWDQICGSGKYAIFYQVEGQETRRVDTTRKYREVSFDPCTNAFTFLYDVQLVNSIWGNEQTKFQTTAFAATQDGYPEIQVCRIKQNLSGTYSYEVSWSSVSNAQRYYVYFWKGGKCVRYVTTTCPRITYFNVKDQFDEVRIGAYFGYKTFHYSSVVKFTPYYDRMERKKPYQAASFYSSTVTTGSKSAFAFAKMFEYQGLEWALYGDLSLDEFRAAIQKLAKGTTEKSRTVLYFHAHGSKTGFSLFNQVDSSGNKLDQTEHIDYEELRQYLDEIKGEKFLFICSCHSGEAITVRDEDGTKRKKRFRKKEEREHVTAATLNSAIISAFRSAKKPSKVNKRSAELRQDHYHVMCSSSGDQNSYSSSGNFGYAPYYWTLACGFDSKYLQPGSVEADENLSESITMKEIYDYAVDKVNDMYDQRTSQKTQEARNQYDQDIMLYPEEDGSIVFKNKARVKELTMGGWISEWK